MSRPHFGFTRHHGFAVHARTLDHLPEETGWQRFNKRAAIWITRNVGSMNAFWLFTVLAGLVIPSCLYAGGYIGRFGFITTFGFELLATLVLSTWLELVLMPAIMVQGNIAAAASDARSAKQFEDTEETRADMKTALDLLDTHTAGGLAEVLAAVRALVVADAQVSAGAGANPAAAGLTADQPVADPPGTPGGERVIPPAATATPRSRKLRDPRVM